MNTKLGQLAQSSELYQLRGLKIAIVHYWLLRPRGGERVVEALCEMFPQADIYTLFYSPDEVQDIFRQHRVTASFLQRLPGSRRYYRALLPLFPIAIEQFDLSSYDIVISSESGIAKGVVLPATVCHVCYCHTPMRYIWDMYHFYRGNRQNWLERLAFALTAHYLRIWDYASAARVGHFIANSTTVQRRIAAHYGRDSEVIPPPVAIGDFFVSSSIDDYYLIVSELVEYKRIDIALEAFNRLGKRLRIVGDGPERKNLQKRAKNNIEFLGFVPQKELPQLYSRALAVLLPGEEDAGIVPVEAQASGRPVIALRAGGVLDTVIEGETGVFFGEALPESLIDAIRRFETSSAAFCPDRIRRHAEQYGKQVFQEKLIASLYHKWKLGRTPQARDRLFDGRCHKAEYLS